MPLLAKKNPKTVDFPKSGHIIYINIYSILQIHTIVFPGIRNVKYLPVFIQQSSFFFFSVGMHVVLNVFLVIQNTDFFIQISKVSIVSKYIKY